MPSRSRLLLSQLHSDDDEVDEEGREAVMTYEERYRRYGVTCGHDRPVVAEQNSHHGGQERICLECTQAMSRRLPDPGHRRHFGEMFGTHHSFDVHDHHRLSVSLGPRPFRPYFECECPCDHRGPGDYETADVAVEALVCRPCLDAAHVEATGIDWPSD